MIKDRKLNIAEDFPKSIAYNRRKLFPVFSKARRIDGTDKRMVSIKGDVLSVRGKKYTVDTTFVITTFVIAHMKCFLYLTEFKYG